MELRDALTQISEIRDQIARNHVFRGYRALPTAAAGALALVAAFVQGTWNPDPATHLGGYLALWIGIAAVSASGALAGILLGVHRSVSPLRRDVAWMAIEQFLPCLVAGSVLTFALAAFAPEAAWLLPGLWQILFSLGVFASCRQLPRPMVAVGIFFLMTGTLCLTLARGDAALSPWAMGAPFCAGLLLAAGILYWTLERDDGTEETH